MKNNKLNPLFMLILAITLVFCASGCEPPLQAETGVPEETQAATPLETATEVAPSPTSTPSTSTVILISSPATDQFTLSQVQSVLETLTTEAGFKLVVQEWTSFEMMANVPMVVSVGEDIDVNSLAQDYPEVSFVAVDNTNAAPSVNVSIIGNPMADQRNRAFMAGYLAALISDDYKVAALIPSETNTTDAVLESFVIGVRFFCGVCQPKYPPYQSFPQWQTISVEEAVEQYQPILEGFRNSGVDVLFIQGDLAASTMLTSTADYGINVVSDKRPDISINNYAGTVLSDPAPALTVLWQKILNGRDGLQMPTSITLVDVDSGLVSEGRYAAFMEMASDLEEGLISVEAAP
ncbi:MAG: hypothetical protein SVP52_07775 [Chloroflexota bacterium]|nr:hypothetical protein [Chloroflexota bacterium]